MSIKRKGLGKGLDSMFPDYQNPEGESGAAAGKIITKEHYQSAISGGQRQEEKKDEKKESTDNTESQKNVVNMKISEIEPNSGQPRDRFDEEALKELSESIRQFGLIQPIVVIKKEKTYEIVAGERRWRAARMAGLKEVPVIIRNYSEQEKLEISLIENIQRENLNAIEQAKAYEKLMDEFHLKQDEIAQKVSKSRTAVTNSIRLLKLDNRVQHMLAEEKITAGHARALLGLEEGEAQYQAACRIADDHLSVREAERLVKKMLRGAHKEEQDTEKNENETINLICREIEENLKTILGTKVSVNRKNDQKGKIEIEYYSGDDLERIYEMLRKLT